ncbi:MAG: bifunctional metallophosphatase/5'-nucleotidase [Bacteroidales bacterium]|nr:bifunctional metallophosphatase/5'-nucleotidase [Bacteroidales bacterium]
MRKNIRNIVSLVALVLCVGFSTAPAMAKSFVPKKSKAQAVIYYDNDVHSHVDGYAVAAKLKKDAVNAGIPSCLVSSGDYVQGASLGASTKGASIVEIMNTAGYDAVTLGNHEFDYGMPRLAELSKALNATIVDCNLFDLRTGRMYAPYKIFQMGGVKVAFLGISTPYSFVSSVPSYFQDDKGNMVYSLCAENLYEVVQESVDNARKEGADYVIVLSHLGDDIYFDPINSHELIANTRGIDVVLDGHSHHFLPACHRKNIDGEPVMLTQTGSYFDYVGCLTISPKGKLSAKLIRSSKVRERDAATLAVIDKVKKDYESVGSRVVGRSETEMIFADVSSPRIVRERESGLGDFCADAIRLTMGTEISMLGGGSIRAAINKGDVTYNDLFTCFPFRNTIGITTLSGQQILDILEFSVATLPAEFGGFLQVSGIKFDVNVRVDSPARIDSNKILVSFEGDKRRVANAMVLNKEGEYEPLQRERFYTVSGSTYLLIEHGDGYEHLFKDTKTVDTKIDDVDILERYITENLGGVIPARYANPEGRIHIRY